jgi:hypothetical protein
MPAYHRPQSSSASRCTAGAFGSLTFAQCAERSHYYEQKKTAPALDRGSYSRFNLARNLVEWSTEAYDTQSARDLSEGNGLSSFTLRGSKQLGSKFLGHATAPNVTPAA